MTARIIVCMVRLFTSYSVVPAFIMSSLRYAFTSETDSFIPLSDGRVCTYDVIIYGRSQG